MRKMRYDITQEQLREFLSYDRNTGLLSWIKHPIHQNKYPPGTRLTSVDGRGYLHVMLKGVRYKAHRLAWLHVYGKWPERWLDHINGIRTDNRICNLRECTPAQNARNSKGWTRQKHGFKGVYRQKKSTQNPWYAAIRYNRKLIYLGSFSTAKLAHQAYCDAAKKHFGQFSREK